LLIGVGGSLCWLALLLAQGTFAELAVFLLAIPASAMTGLAAPRSR
jgi:hypothetical protein